MSFPTTDGLFLLPSYNRPELLWRFFEAFRHTGATLPGVVILADEDPALPLYHKLELPPLWSFWIMERSETEPERCFAASLRGWMAAHQEFMGWCKWLGFLTDDHLPITPGWDVELVKTLQGRVHIASTNDGWQAPRRMVGAQVHTGAVLRAVGYFFPPRFRHLYIDDIWESIGRVMNIWQTRMDILVEHHHYLNPANPARKDPVYQETEKFYSADAALYAEWCRTEFPQVCERVNKLIVPVKK